MNIDEAAEAIEKVGEDGSGYFYCGAADLPKTICIDGDVTLAQLKRVVAIWESLKTTSDTA